MTVTMPRNTIAPARDSHPTQCPAPVSASSGRFEVGAGIERVYRGDAEVCGTLTGVDTVGDGESGDPGKAGVGVGSEGDGVEVAGGVATGAGGTITGVVGVVVGGDVGSSVGGSVGSGSGRGQSMTTGVSGVAGTAGTAGTSGEPGTAGVPGTAGTAGFTRTSSRTSATASRVVTSRVFPVALYRYSVVTLRYSLPLSSHCSRKVECGPDDRNGTSVLDH
jgi:hypothetical protein